MELGTIIVLIVFGYIFYKLFSGGNGSKNQKQIRRPPSRNQLQQNNGYRVRATGRGSDTRRSNQTGSSIIQSAKRQERLGNYDEASRLYLRADQVFSAAKMKALKGPQDASAAVDVIKLNAPNDQTEMIVRNLVNEFYYRLELPATAASLLRAYGLVPEAQAVEIAANIEPQIIGQNYAADAEETPTSVVQEVIEEPQIVVEETKTKEPITTEVKSGDSYPNTLLMASTNLADPCSVCKRGISSGDSFVQCISCGKPGHYKHLAEIMKVVGKCPICKERLVTSMYQF